MSARAVNFSQTDTELGTQALWERQKANMVLLKSAVLRQGTVGGYSSTRCLGGRANRKRRHYLHAGVE
jgi:hypothetical protein